MSSYIVPNRIMLAFFKQNVDKLINFYNLNDNDKFKRFYNDQARTELLKVCESTGIKCDNFLNHGNVVIHKPIFNNSNTFYVSILTPFYCDYYYNLSQFYSDFKDYIDLGGYTYILNSNALVCEFNITKKIIDFIKNCNL